MKMRRDALCPHVIFVLSLFVNFSLHYFFFFGLNSQVQNSLGSHLKVGYAGFKLNLLLQFISLNFPELCIVLGLYSW